MAAELGGERRHLVVAFLCAPAHMRARFAHFLALRRSLVHF